jgi:hypothetical protein
MRFVELEIGEVGRIWVNPDLVRFVGAPEDDSPTCTLHFDHNHYAQVAESGPGVIAKLVGEQD